MALIAKLAVSAESPALTQPSSFMMS